jgi:hypothetical protein
MGQNCQHKYSSIAIFLVFQVQSKKFPGSLPWDTFKFHYYDAERSNREPVSISCRKEPILIVQRENKITLTRTDIQFISFIINRECL